LAKPCKCRWNSVGNAVLTVKICTAACRPKTYRFLKRTVITSRVVARSNNTDTMPIRNMGVYFSFWETPAQSRMLNPMRAPVDSSTIISLCL
jgi:hypothetical protein